MSIMSNLGVQCGFDLSATTTTNNNNSNGCSRDVGSFGHIAHRYCTVAGHYSRSSQPAALTESSASWI